MAANKDKIKKQVENLLSDINLARHKYFNDRVREGKGWLQIEDILNNINAKNSGLKIEAKDIVEAI